MSDDDVRDLTVLAAASRKLDQLGVLTTLNATQTASMIGVTPHRLLSLTARGEGPPSTTTGGQKTPRWFLSSVLHWMSKRKATTVTTTKLI